MKRINGHSFTELEEALAEVPFGEGHPSVLIADTIRGRGCPVFRNGPTAGSVISPTKK
ncbi:MAG: hypothetical protein R3C44_06880 [Chloroflexota bacterium]